MTDDTKRAIEAAKDLLAWHVDFDDGDVGTLIDTLRTALSALDRLTEETSNSAEELARKVCLETGCLCGGTGVIWVTSADSEPCPLFQAAAQALVAYRATGVREEQKRLRLVVTETNDALLELNHGDHEEIIACHADTLPEMYREMALAVEKAVDILQVEIHAMIDPDISTTPGEKP